MKPYTLEWWIDIMLQSIDRQEQSKKNFNSHIGTGLSDVWWEKYQNERKLGRFIYDRIINKYGEQ